MLNKTLLRWYAVIGWVISGVIHLSVFAEQWPQSIVHGGFFGIIGLAQLAWAGYVVWKKPQVRGLSASIGSLLSGGMIMIWVLTHLIATPFSQESHPITLNVIISKIAESIAFFSWITLTPRLRKPALQPIGLFTGIIASIIVWSVGVLTTPLFPQAIHQHAQAVNVSFAPNTAAYFSIINTGREVERLTHITTTEPHIVTLHETRVNAENVAQMLTLDSVELRPHTRVDFSPTAKHIMIDGLKRSYYEGETFTLTLHFESGKSIEVNFSVLMFPLDGQFNFSALDGFQITNAWARATASSDGMVLVDDGGYEWQLPQGFPMPRVPSDNPMTAEKVELGRYLFYDTRLSGNQTTSCSSCHLQELAFSDGRVLPIGSTGEIHPRNSMGLTNSAYSATLTWANPNLVTFERQIVIPMFGEHPIEMGITGHEEEVLTRFRDDPAYQAMFTAAFPDQTGDELYSFRNVVLALSSFTRTLISGNSSYDQYLRGNQEALSESAKRGMSLFLSESLECHHCHTGFNMTLSTVTANSTFEERPFFNTGLYNIGGTGAYPQGNTGVREITNKAQDMGRFRPPSLRNAALTAPYMHDGSVATLEEVIRFYMDGGRLITEGEYAGDGRQNPYQSGFVAGFNISDQEVADLVAFLESLTDESFITDPRFSNPFIIEATPAPQ